MILPAGKVSEQAPRTLLPIHSKDSSTQIETGWDNSNRNVTRTLCIERTCAECIFEH